MTLITTAAVTDHSRTTPQARTMRVRQVPMISRYRRARVFSSTGSGTRRGRSDRSGRSDRGRSAREGPRTEGRVAGGQRPARREENGPAKSADRAGPFGEGSVQRSFLMNLKTTKFAGPLSQHHEYKTLGTGAEMIANMRKDLAKLREWLA